MKYIVCQCELCSHAWLATGDIPARCAKCKSSQWDGQEKRERGRPKQLPAPAVEEPKAIEVYEPIEEEMAEAMESQLVADEEPIEAQVVDVVEDWPEYERVVARKNGHALGCVCYACENTRKFMKPKKDTGSESASDRPKKWSKSNAGKKVKFPKP
jgi:hypothetical protein